MSIIKYLRNYSYSTFFNIYYVYEVELANILKKENFSNKTSFSLLNRISKKNVSFDKNTLLLKIKFKKYEKIQVYDSDKEYFFIGELLDVENFYLLLNTETGNVEVAELKIKTTSTHEDKIIITVYLLKV